MKNCEIAKQTNTRHRPHRYEINANKSLEPKITLSQEQYPNATVMVAMSLRSEKLTDTHRHTHTHDEWLTYIYHHSQDDFALFGMILVS